MVLYSCGYQKDQTSPYSCCLITHWSHIDHFDQRFAYALSDADVHISQHVVEEYFVWHDIRARMWWLVRWTRECIKCQWNKVTLHHRFQVEHILVPEELFCHVHIDLVGPFSCFWGFTHLLILAFRSLAWGSILSTTTYVWLPGHGPLSLSDRLILAFLITWPQTGVCSLPHPYGLQPWICLEWNISSCRPTICSWSSCIHWILRAALRACLCSASLDRWAALSPAWSADYCYTAIRQ